MKAENQKTSALQITDLSYSYRGQWNFKPHQVLKKISFSVYQGECFGFLGHNGAGKTTTLKCILGLNRPTQGKIEIFGVSAEKDSARSGVGFLPEQPYFYDYLSVEEILVLYAELAGIPKLEQKEEIKRVLEEVCFTSQKHKRLRSLSKGMLQKVGMAQALLGRPRLLILDEPFSGLDPIGRFEFKELFYRLKEAGTTIIMSSHVLGDIEFLCDRASILVQGELREIFTLSDLLEKQSHGYLMAVRNDGKKIETANISAEHVEERGPLTYFTFKDSDSAHLGLHMILHQQLAVETFESVSPTLEETFVRIVKEHQR
jgi:ABC-2 type transport system ATP-binding protein